MEIIGDPEALKREILESARRESEALLAAAGTEAARILAAAQAGAAAARLALLDSARAEGERRRAMLLASVPAEAARLRAVRLEELLDAVKAEALALLAPTGADPGRAAALAAEAAAGIGGNSFVISSAPGSGLSSLAGEIERLASLGPLELRFEEDPAVHGGAAARSTDGSRRWDNSFSGRLERFWPELRREIAAELADGGVHER